MPKAKSYTGRLAFDPESGFHVGEDGQQVVTEDGGISWREAKDGDASHIERYQERVLNVDTTANAAAEDPNAIEPHHYEVQPDDPHFNGVRSDPDVEAATITGHTDAYQEG